MLQPYPMVNIAQVDQTGKGKITEVDAKNPEKKHARRSLSGGQIAQATGLLRATVKRIIRGDRRHKAKLAGLGWVRWDDGKGRSGTRYRLTDEGAKIAELLAKGISIGKATLRALAIDYIRRRGLQLPPDALEAFVSDYIEKGLAALQDPRVVAILLALKPTAPKNVTTNVTTSFITMPSNDGFKNKCSPSAVGFVNPLAERLTAELGFNPIVANRCATTFSAAEIQATIAFVRYRAQRGDIKDTGAFGYWWLSRYARSYVQACLQPRQRPRPKPPDEPDWDAAIAALQEALEPFGIRVDDDCCAEFANGRVPLPPDPDKAIAFLRRHGLLRETKADQPDANGFQAADQRFETSEPTPIAPDDALWASNVLHDDFWASDQDPTEALADANEQIDDLWAADHDGQNDPNGDGENCPSLTVGFRAADDLHDDLHDALVDANPYQPELKAMAWAADQDLPADNGQNDLSDDGENCPSPSFEDLGFDFKAEGDDEDEKSQRHPTQSFVWRARNGRRWEIKPFGH